MNQTLILIFLYLLCFFTNAQGQEMRIKDCFFENKIRSTIRIIEDDYGFIWWAREDGFYRYDGKSIDFIDPSAGIPNVSFYAAANISHQKNGDYWFSAREMGVFHYAAQQDSFHLISKLVHQDSTFDIYARHVSIVPDQGIFIATQNGVWQLDEDKNLVRRIQPAEPFGKLRVGRHHANEIRKTLYDIKRNVLWLGGMTGLLSYDLATQKLTRHPTPFLNTEINEYSFLVNDLFLQDDKLTMATWGGGIQTYDIEKKTWEQFVFEDEVDVDYRHGNTQLGRTPNGRFFFAHETREVGSWKPGEPYIISPKIKETILSRGVGAQVDRLGYLWIGHRDGTCRYIVTNEPPIAKSSQIYVKKILINQIPQQQMMQRWDNQNLILVKKPDTLSFVFRAINPLSYDNVFYEYRLEGWSGEWVENDTSETAVFSNLENGDYLFQARYFDAISQQYIYTDKVSIQIEEENLFSQSFVNILLSIVFIGFFGFLYYRHLSRKKILKAEEKYEAQLREVQDAALRSQMNPHFLFNSLNSIRYFIVTNDNEIAANYLTQFSRLIRMILENSNKKLVTLAEEIQLLDLYVKMEQIRFENKFDYEIKLADDIDKDGLMIPPMLIQPYLENAIIHGINPKEGRGKITLSFKIAPPFLVIEIEDDGIGRKQSLQHKKDSVFKKTSLGLSITKARLDLVDTPKHKADLKIEDLLDEEKRASGTKVIIKLPLQ